MPHSGQTKFNMPKQVDTKLNYREERENWTNCKIIYALDSLKEI